MVTLLKKINQINQSINHETQEGELAFALRVTVTESLAKQFVAIEHSLALLLNLFLPALLSPFHSLQHSVPSAWSPHILQSETEQILKTDSLSACIINNST